MLGTQLPGNNIHRRESGWLGCIGVLYSSSFRVFGESGQAGNLLQSAEAVPERGWGGGGGVAR